MVDSASAHRASAASTGHATRPLTLAPLPEHLVLDAHGEAVDVTELIAGIERGLFVPALTSSRETVGGARIARGALTAAVTPRTLAVAGLLTRARAATRARRLVAHPPHCPGGKGAALVPALRCDR